MAYPSPLLLTNFYVNKRKLSNKYNCTNFFIKKIQFQIQRLSVLVYAFVAIAEKFPFLLTSSLVKPPLPLMSENVSISLTPPPPQGCWRHMWMAPYLVWFERFALNMTRNYVNVYIKKNKDNIWYGWFVKIMWEFFSPSNKTENRISVHDHEFL